MAHGHAGDIAGRVREHLDAGADHVSLHLFTAASRTPPLAQWAELAAHLLA